MTASQKIHTARKGQDAEFANLAVTTLTINGDAILATSVLLSAGEVVALAGEADALTLDADGNTSISAPTDNQIDIEVNGADDFKITANTFTALSGSTIATNTIAETTAASGVTIDSLLVKDAGLVVGTSGALDLNGEAGGLILDAAAVVVLEGATAGHAKLDVSGSNVVDVSAAATALTGTLSATGIITASGGVKTPVVTISGDGAITIAPFTIVRLSKGSAAAITLAAPTNTTHDGYIVMAFSSTAFAHVITGSVDGFNAKGASGTITLGGAIGDSVTLVAMGGHWYTLATVNAVVA